MNVGIKWHVRAWITDIIVGSANWRLTGTVVPIHSQLVVKKTQNPTIACVKKRKGSFRNISLRYWERKITSFHFYKRTHNGKTSRGFTRAGPFRKALNTGLALLISKIFLLLDRLCCTYLQQSTQLGKFYCVFWIFFRLSDFWLGNRAKGG